jgi:hypothetical protein
MPSNSGLPPILMKSLAQDDVQSQALTSNRSGPSTEETQHSDRAQEAEQLELPLDVRSTAVFRQWLQSMASDAEAALAAAMSYREMSPSGRDQWIRFLQSDIQGLDIPRIAIFAPLLSVEQDPDRRNLLEWLALGDEEQTGSVAVRAAFVASKSGGERVYVLVCPLYLHFVQVLACGVKDGSFIWVRHDPIVSQIGAPVAGDLMQGAKLELTSFNQALDELARVVLSHQRAGNVLPEAIYMLGDLLGGIGP